MRGVSPRPPARVRARQGVSEDARHLILVPKPTAVRTILGRFSASPRVALKKSCILLPAATTGRFQQPA
jgi:hypothetical protein